MSIENPFSPNFGWKVDPDRLQDRRNGICLSRQMTQEEKMKYGVSVGVSVGTTAKRKEWVKMLKMTKKEVLKMIAEGKTVEEIVEHFIEGNEKVRSMYTAKATLFLYGPKERQDKKEKSKDDILEKIMPTLKMRSMEDAEIKLTFYFGDVALLIERKDKEPAMVSWDKLDIFISDLQKIKQIHESM